MNKNARRGMIAGILGLASLMAASGMEMAQADSTGNFLVVSNHGEGIGKVCFTAYSSSGKELGHKCGKIANLPHRRATRYIVPTGTSYTDLSYQIDAMGLGGRKIHIELPNTKNYCFRITAGGTFHDALDKPCTLS
ncbi:MAG: hypothetical protein JO362_17575 [Streptomycetaceae bacterium]|nr:hypothetical protein [Streptomycetaceae bacterium]